MSDFLLLLTCFCLSYSIEYNVGLQYGWEYFIAE